MSGIEDILRQVMAGHDQEAPGAPDLLRALEATSGPPGGRGKWSGLLVPLAAAAATAAVVAASLAISAIFHGHARPAAGAGTWRTAIEVPGLGSLNKGGDAEFNSVSCASPGNCAAGGLYTNRSVNRQAFVVSEQNGSWRKAIRVPGPGALNAGGGAGVNSVSCGSAGNCAAGGFYTDGHGHGQAFVVSERNGTWGKPIEVPGSGALNKGGGAGVLSVSCASAGNCAAGGRYTGAHVAFQAFVVSERNGAWGKAIAVIPNAGGAAVATSVSCASAGNCAAVGFYSDGHLRAFVISETNGTWGKARQVPGLGTLNKGGNATATSVSCASAGNCAAGGGYTDGSGRFQAFVVSEQNGTWRAAIEVPGLGILNKGGDAGVNSVSCGSAGNCAAGGDYTEGSVHQQAFVVSETNGSWGKAIRVPGSGALNAGGFAQVISVSCASAGNCAAGGFYVDSTFHAQGFVVSETNGTWGKATRVPGLGTLNKGRNAAVNSVSCASAGNCAAGGTYHDGSGNQQAFVVSQT